MFSRLTRCLPLAAAFLLSAGSAHASLIGDTISGSLAPNPNMWGIAPTQFAPSAIVGSGAEFTGQYGFAPQGQINELWDISVDVGATTITVSAYENTAGSNNLYYYTGTLFRILLDGLDLGSDITGVNLVSGQSQWAGYDVVTTSFGAHSVELAWHNLDFGSANLPPNGGSWTFELVSGAASPNVSVPEPATSALAGLALLGMAAVRRRRR